jgi:acyl carrier protein
MMATVTDILALVGELQLPVDMSTLNAEASFKENGIDSLDLMTIFLAVEEKFQLKLSDAELEEIHSLADLAARINQKLSA